MSARGARTIALMLESDGPGGAETFLLQSAEELRRRGHRVVPVLPSWKTGWLAGQFEGRGFDCATFTLRRVLDWECLQCLVTGLDRLGVDVVHSHEFTMAVYGSAATRILGKRHVITIHGNRTMTGALRRRLALRFAFWASEETVAVSEDTRRYLLESMGLRPDAVRTIPNGIPDPAGDPAGPIREFALRPDEVVILSVGNLTSRKAHILLLRALKRVQDRGCEVPWRLVIAGDGPERPKLEAFRREAGLEDRIHLPGYRSDVGDLQAAAQITVMPSLWEGLPLAVLEGMFEGNAIVGSEVSGIPEAVRDGVDGILTPPGDVEAIAEALHRLLVDPDLRRRMGDSAARRAREAFSIERMMDDYETLYDGLEG